MVHHGSRRVSATSNPSTLQRTHDNHMKTGDNRLPKLLLTFFLLGLVVEIFVFDILRYRGKEDYYMLFICSVPLQVKRSGFFH
jgi:hypothetical protein